MNGQIVKFVDRLQQGVIVAENGERFRFFYQFVRNPSEKLVGLEVDFLVESRQPRDIIALHGSPWAVFSNRA